MKVEILSPGCPNCDKLFERVKEMVNTKGIDADVAKVEDMDIIRNYGVFMMPAVVVDGAVKVAGKIPADSDLLSWLIPAG